MEVRETATISERAASAARSSGKMLVQFISPGWGSSGYYSPEVISEAASNRVIPAGTHMYADHPTAEDRKKRPERSIRDLMAVTTSDAQLSSDGALVGEVRVLAPYQTLIQDLKDHIGVSIIGDASDIYEGEADGRQGRIIAGLAKVHSVDFVTRAGRGGQVLQLLESAGVEVPALTEATMSEAWLVDGAVPALEDLLLETIRLEDDLDSELYEVVTSAQGAEGTARLHRYWATHIKWGKPGDFDECVRHLSKYVRDPKGYCAKMHKDVTGATPGHAAGESDNTERVITVLESGLGLDEEGHTYRYRHGWIPINPGSMPWKDREAAALKIAPKGSTVRIGSQNYRVAGYTIVPKSAAYNNESNDKLDVGLERLNDKGVVVGRTSSRMTHEQLFQRRQDAEKGSGNSGEDKAIDDLIAKLEDRKRELMRLPSYNSSRSAASDQVRDINRQIARLVNQRDSSAPHQAGSVTTPRGAEHPALRNPAARSAVKRPSGHDPRSMTDAQLQDAVDKLGDSPAAAPFKQELMRRKKKSPPKVKRPDLGLSRGGQRYQGKSDGGSGTFTQGPRSRNSSN